MRPVTIPLPGLIRFRRPHPVILSRRVGLSGLGSIPQVLPASAVQTIAGTIVTQEGYNPAFAANNNPGNLMYAGQTGAVPGAGGFAAFPTYQAGLDALNNQIQLYAGRGLTIQGMMDIYAPAKSGNDPILYASKVAGALGVTPDTPLTALDGSNPTPAELVPTSVATDSGVVSLDSLMPSGLDPVLLVIGTGVVGLFIYAFSE